MKLSDSTADDLYDRLVPWAQGIAWLNDHHLGAASKGTWEKRSKMKGFPVRWPDGRNGKRYIVPGEVDAWLRSRCTEQTPGQNVAPRPRRVSAKDDATAAEVDG